jgi:hypothetical protein
VSAARDRKEAAKRLGVELQAKHRALVDATGPEAINAAAVELGAVFNANLSFIIWALKEYGGVVQMPIARERPARSLPVTPGLFLEPTGQDQ